MKRDLLLVLAIAATIASSYAIYIATPVDPVAGDLYRILYLHVPVAWIAYLSFTISFVSCILFLRRRQTVFDSVAEITAVMGLVYGAVALVSGAIWANAAWGSYWNWDPRETTTLILWIAYVGYLSLRFSLGEGDRRGVVSAVYNILAFFTIPLSYLSITLVPTLHPQIVTGAGIALSLPMLGTLLLSVIAATLLYAYLLVTAMEIRALALDLGARLHDLPGGA